VDKQTQKEKLKAKRLIKKLKRAGQEEFVIYLFIYLFIF